MRQPLIRRVAMWGILSAFAADTTLAAAGAEGPATRPAAGIAPATAPATRPAATQPGPLGPGDHRRELTVGGRDRSYLLHVPPGYDPKRPTPVVLAFHGAMMNGPMMA